jgi:hypothetical protein
MTILISSKRRIGQRGSNMTEFALLSVFLMPLFMGTMSVGMSLGKAIQTIQVARDAGHMFVRQVDFSQTANKNLIVRIAQGMGMTLNGGNGVVILSQVLQIGSSDCAAGGFTDAQCTNLHHAVIIQRLTIGNTSLYSSTIGTPPSGLLAADGTASPTDYLTNSAFQAQTLSVIAPSPNAAPGLLTLQPSERTYVAESYFNAPELSFLNNGQTLRTYARSYF